MKISIWQHCQSVIHHVPSAIPFPFPFQCPWFIIYSEKCQSKKESENVWRSSFRSTFRCSLHFVYKKRVPLVLLEFLYFVISEFSLNHISRPEISHLPSILTNFQKPFWPIQTMDGHYAQSHQRHGDMDQDSEDGQLLQSPPRRGASSHQYHHRTANRHFKADPPNSRPEHQTASNRHPNRCVLISHSIGDCHFLVEQSLFI